MSGGAQAALARALFAPRGVAVVGASDDPAKPSARPLRYLRRHGFEGAVYPVNPRRETVGGERAWPSLAAVPGPVDHAFVVTASDRVEAAVEDCIGAGVPVATILADGFADAGPEGRARQAALCRRAAAGGLRLLGPNSLGLAVPGTGLALTANAAFEAERLIPGRTALLSQSGSVLGTLLSRGQARGLGFSHLVSVGNEADLGLGELGSLLVDDPGVDVLLLFLEALRDGPALADMARRAHAAGKAVVAYKLGRSEAGRGAALTHTGAIVGTDAAADAFFRRHGIRRVDQIETLVEIAPLIAGRPAGARPGGAAVVTTTGGGGAMAADRLGLAGVALAMLPEEARARLAARGIVVKEGQIADLTLAGTRPEVMGAVVEELAKASDTGLVVAAVGSSAQFHPELAAAALARFAGSEPPVAAFLVPEAPETARMLAERGIATFRTPEALADAAAALLHAPAPGRAPTAGGPEQAAILRALAAGDGRNLLEALAIPAVPEVTLKPGDPLPDALPFPYPVTLKLAAGVAAHKTEAGGVALGLADRAALDAARARMLDRAAAYGLGTPPLAIQPMIAGLGEALLGFHVDPGAGPIVSLGAGGVLTEVYGDATVELAPVTLDIAAAMIGRVRGLAPLRGYRGAPRGDLETLAAAIVSFSWLAAAADAYDVAAEINPLIVGSEGVTAVDWLLSATPKGEAHDRQTA